MDKFVSVKPLDGQLDPNQRVLKGQDYKRLLTYEQLIKSVELQEKKRNQEATAALAGALRRGYQQGKDQANEQLAEELVRFTAKMNESVADVERRLADVVTQAVRKIVETFDDEVLVNSAISSGLELVRGSQKLTIRVNPHMHSSVTAKIEALQENTRYIEVVGDTQLKGDECILESDIGIVNASVEQQLATITKTIKKVFPDNSTYESTYREIY